MSKHAPWIVVGGGVFAVMCAVACGGDDDSTSNTPPPTTGGAANGGATSNGGSPGTTGGAGGSTTQAGNSGTTGGAGGTTTQGGSGGTTSQGGASGGAGGSAGAGGTLGSSKVRFAHLAPKIQGDDTATVKVCATPSGGGDAVELTSSLPGGLGYPKVSGYLTVTEGTYDVAVVPGSGDCTGTALVSASGVVVPKDGTFTALVSGDVNATDDALKPSIRVLTDEASTDTSASHIRFVHAAAGTPAVDVGAYAPTGFAKVFPDVDYGVNSGLGAKNSDPLTPIDAAGYASVPIAIDPTTIFEVRIAANGNVYADLSSPVPVAVGTTATVFAYGTLAVDESGQASGVNALACLDGVEADGLTTCADFVAAAADAPRPSARLAHVSPDAALATVDVCVKPASFPTWLDDDSQVLAPAVPYQTVTAALPGQLLPADAYDVKILPSAATPSCATASADPALEAHLTLATTDRATVAATGVLADGANKFAITTFENTDTAIDASHASVRVVNAAVGLGPIDVGIQGQNLLWNGVAYDAASAYQSILINGGDELGVNYTSTQAFDLVTAQLTAAESTVKNDVYTLWVVGDGTSGATNPTPSILLCLDAPQDAASATEACSKLPLVPPSL